MFGIAVHGRFASNDLRYRESDHQNQTQFTPGYVLEPVRIVLGGDRIGLDSCTTADNPVGARSFYYLPMDGLEQYWEAGSIFVNPPYGKAREPLVERCMQAADAGSRVVLLIPSATDTRIFQRALRSAGSAVLIQGRVKFGTLRPNRRQVAASHPSALIGWNVDLKPCAYLGMLVRA